MIMDAIFATPEEEGHCRLLKIIQDFLVSEALKYATRGKGRSIDSRRIHLFNVCISESSKKQAKTSSVNMEELVGNTEGFADSG